MPTYRRGFLTSGFLAAIAALSSPRRAWSAPAESTAQGSSAEQRLRELGIELPPPPAPVAVYVPTVRVGDMLYVAGMGPRTAAGYAGRGKVGRDVSLEDAAGAARVTGLNVLSAVRHSLGSLDKVVRLVRVHGMVNADPDFGEHPKVINGFSELMVEVFGEEAGKGTRSAVGMGSLPFNNSVEIESQFLVRD
jgi:enamine deaminase RidA (YjgF/YER057c/UK114 family)